MYQMEDFPNNPQKGQLKRMTTIHSMIQSLTQPYRQGMFQFHREGTWEIKSLEFHTAKR